MYEYDKCETCGLSQDKSVTCDFCKKSIKVNTEIDLIQRKPSEYFEDPPTSWEHEVCSIECAINMLKKIQESD